MWGCMSHLPVLEILGDIVLHRQLSLPFLALPDVVDDDANLAAREAQIAHLA